MYCSRPRVDRRNSVRSRHLVRFASNPQTCIFKDRSPFYRHSSDARLDWRALLFLCGRPLSQWTSIQAGAHFEDKDRTTDRAPRPKHSDDSVTDNTSIWLYSLYSATNLNSSLNGQSSTIIPSIALLLALPPLLMRLNSISVEEMLSEQEPNLPFNHLELRVEADRHKSYTPRADCPDMQSSASCLPPELIADIFLWVAKQSDDQDILDTKGPPWILGHVCGRWRDIALASTSLWRAILITSPLPPWSAEILEECLSRSGTQSLMISITMSSDDLPSCQRQLSTILKSLYKHCHRWQLLQLDIPDIEAVLTTSLGTVDGKALLRLEEVYMLESKPSVFDQSLSSQFERAFLHAPRLLKADLRSHPVLSQLDTPPPSFAHLTHFAGTILRMADIYNILSFPCLVECHLCGPVYLDSTAAVTHPNILRLCVETVSVLRGLTLPNLTSLSFFCRQTSHGEAEILSDFVSRSSCKIVVLAVSFPRLIMSLIPTLLDSSMRSIKRLCVSYVPGDSTVMRTLEFLASSVFPQLEVISIATYILSPPPPKESAEAGVRALLALMSYRFEHAKRNKVQRIRLLRVCLCEDDVIDEWRREGLDKLEKQGLVVEHNQTYGTDRHWTGPFWFLEDDIPE